MNYAGLRNSTTQHMHMAGSFSPSALILSPCLHKEFLLFPFLYPMIHNFVCRTLLTFEVSLTRIRIFHILSGCAISKQEIDIPLELVDVLLSSHNTLTNPLSTPSNSNPILSTSQPMDWGSLFTAIKHWITAHPYQTAYQIATSHLFGTLLAQHTFSLPLRMDCLWP